ncbi:hypothetical protein [Oceanimonas doudoroffii]|uniref:hypothetical protein n=1 Tax=Oceanimonas doudoroffii TaxID=84158 RepID=UPI001FE6B1E6|nr:hypothetical protein [Oceanimonas doudoroffii]
MVQPITWVNRHGVGALTGHPVEIFGHVARNVGRVEMFGGQIALSGAAIDQVAGMLLLILINVFAGLLPADAKKLP